MKKGADLRVEEVMTAEPMTIDGMAPVTEALALMQERNISSLVVTRRDADDEYGLLLVADIARGISTSNRPVSRIQVYEVMQKPAPAVDAEMKLKYAVRFMTRFGISHCVVLRGRDLAGIVSLRDITIRFLEQGAAPDAPSP
ncbi:MAG: CBS domain-containing protein [Alphaproteobacteria bacterium]|nr:CBS domain-containing protein [Alphaproteobacteria bacterium]MCW5743236.1 CBS domain-containing protein [Alphaproteobacteria bacterium]